LAIGTGGLAVETGAAGLLGDLVANNAKIIPVIQAGAGFVEGTVKSIFGPDPESSNSMFLNPASDFGMNAAEGIWNGWAVLKGSNPLPNP